MTPRLAIGGAGLLALVACGVPEPKITVSEDITTFATASWTFATDSRTRIEVTNDDGPWLTTDWQEGAASHEVGLLGLFADTTYQARLVVEDGDASPYVTFATGDIPASLPRWTIDGEPGWEGFVLTAIVGGDTEASTLVIFDELGRVVWYHQGRKGHRILRVRLLPDRSGLRYAEIETVPEPETSALVTVSWSGEELSRVEIPGFTHDFVDTPEGDAMCIVLDIRQGRGELDVLGDAIEPVTADGPGEPIWSIWDHATPPVDADMEQQVWTHANAIDWDPDRQSYWLGLRELSQIVQVFPDGTQGAQFGGTEPTWAIADPADATKFQHQFEFFGDELLVFDDRDPKTAEESRLMQYTLDDAAGTATPTWEWHHPDHLQVITLGDVDRAADGSTLAVFSSSGVVVDLDPNGEIRWQLETEFASVIPYVVRVPDLPGVSRVR